MEVRPDMFKRLLSVALLTVLFVLWSCRNAHAYLDPSTGSYVIQMIVAGLLGGLFAVKMFWRNLKSLRGGHISKKSNARRDEY